MTVAVAVPVKPFDSAKERLASILEPSQRRAISRALAEHTLSVIADAGLTPTVLAADREVAAWAFDRGATALLDPGSSLDGAAGAGTLHAAQPWIVLHADLPLLHTREVTEAAELVDAGQWVLAPSTDGGTSLIGGQEPFRFAYGPGSFTRHLARLARLEPTILVRVGLSLDLDTEDDWRAALRHRRGAWLTGGE